MFNSFYAADLFWNPLKKSENLWFSVFRGNQKRSEAWNGLTSKSKFKQSCKTWYRIFLLPKIFPSFLRVRFGWYFVERSHLFYYKTNKTSEFLWLAGWCIQKLLLCLLEKKGPENVCWAMMAAKNPDKKIKCNIK